MGTSGRCFPSGQPGCLSVCLVSRAAWNWGLVAFFYFAFGIVQLIGQYRLVSVLRRAKRSASPLYSSVGPFKAPAWCCTGLGTIPCVFLTEPGIVPFCGIVFLGFATALLGYLSFDFRKAEEFIKSKLYALPALTSGMLFGLTWSWFGWKAALVTGGTALGLLAWNLHDSRWLHLRSRSRFWSFALTFYWAFAVSVQLVNPEVFYRPLAR